MEEIVLVAPRLENTFFTGRGPQFFVDFDFSCDLYLRKHYGDVLLEHTLQLGIMRASVRMDIQQFMNSECSHQLINLGLREWPLDDVDHRELSDYAIHAAKELIRHMPPQHNVLVIPLKVFVVCDRSVDENYVAMELVARLSMQEADSGMIPATDASIESLEIKTTANYLRKDDDDQSCSICLEDFGCEVLSMPCSHIFHEDCIKKWLKSSHYCPICRFQMPTSRN